MNIYPMSSSSGTSLDNHGLDSATEETLQQSDPFIPWSTVENFVNTSLFSQPMTNSIWSTSAPATGTWSKDPIWQKVADTSRGGWGSNLVHTDAGNKDPTPLPVSQPFVDSLSQLNLGPPRPFLPSCLDSPKNALTMWYGQRYKNFLQFKTNECFTTWDDGGKPHEVKFTSIFTCPVSGEHFISGRYGKERDVYVVVKDEKTNFNVFWFYKKQHAQHAAAARALDCLSYREGKGVRTMAYGLCDDEPYMSEENAPPLPSCAPTLLLESKAELLVKQHATVEEKSEENCVENERIEDRETYRQSRVPSAPDMDDAESNLNADDP